LCVRPRFLVEFIFKNELDLLVEFIFKNEFFEKYLISWSSSFLKMNLTRTQYFPTQVHFKKWNFPLERFIVLSFVQIHLT